MVCSGVIFCKKSINKTNEKKKKGNFLLDTENNLSLFGVLRVLKLEPLDLSMYVHR